MNHAHHFLFFTPFIVFLPLLNGTGSELKWRKTEILLLVQRPVHVGDGVTFYCKMPGSEAEQEPVIHLRGGRRNQTTKWHYANSGVEFHIEHVSKNDEGTYYCEVQSNSTFELNQKNTSVLLQIEETAFQGPHQRRFPAVRVVLIAFALHLVVLLKRIMTNRREEDSDQPSSIVL